MIDYRIKGMIVNGMGAAHTTISEQKPFFKDIPNIEQMFVGTINLNISPNLIKPLQFDYFIEPVNWGMIESFGFCKTKVEYNAQQYDGYLYFPSNSPHFRNKYFFDYLEIICKYIPDLRSGPELSIYIDKSKIDVYQNI